MVNDDSDPFSFYSPTGQDLNGRDPSIDAGESHIECPRRKRVSRLPNVNAYLSCEGFWKEGKTRCWRHRYPVCTYAIRQAIIFRVRRCRCVSNTVLVTHAKITRNRRLKKTNSK